jgi:tRNA pseudouridine55 synthase
VTDLPLSGGLLLVDKPAGPTSHDVVAVARRALGTRRVGHTGTLDPFATGLLVLCIGAGTRLVEFLTGLPKRYLAGVVLGERTTTDDPEGEVEATSDAWRALDRADVERALESLRGAITQTPSRFSAKKVAGTPAHYRARRGEEVELAPISVEVHALDLLAWNPPALELDVRCSAGTYVRTLARDLGEKLGTGAHLRSLRRTEVGAFQVSDALDLDALHDPDAVSRAWIRPAAALAHLPQVQVGPDDAARLAFGQSVPCDATSAAAEGPLVVLLGDELVAIAERTGERLVPRKVFNSAEPAA